MSERSESIKLDVAWYRATYPDVAQAGIEPRLHYLRHGRFEGRLPCPLTAAAQEDVLWAGGERTALPELQALTLRSGLEATWAAWALARWYAAERRWPAAAEALGRLAGQPLAGELFPHAGPRLLAALAAREAGEYKDALVQLAALPATATADAAVARLAVLPPELALEDLNTLYAANGLRALRWSAATAGIDALTPQRAWRMWRSRVPRRECVSVIMPVRNAAATLTTALRSVLAQSWRELEVIVVDDASTDATAAIADGFARQDRRVRLLRQSVAKGVYAARNAGLAQARGTYLTTHDADDWSHPEKIERQVLALEARPLAVACLSWWARVDSRLAVQCVERVQNTLLQRNLSSLLFRRSVFEILGFWDRVAAGADSEYWLRIQRAFGEAAVIDVLPGIPLAFGRVTDTALTQSPATHWRTLYGGVRKDYLDTALAWHARAENLRLPAQPAVRPFAVPAVLLVDEVERLRISAAFDGNWYRARYPDVAAAHEDPAQHYLRHGAAEGRDPGPHFSSSAYALIHELPAGSNPVLDHVERDSAVALPLRLSGARPTSPTRPRVLVCAHTVQTAVYGAERSLLDLLVAFERLGWDCTVALPGAANADYVEAVRARVAEIVFLPCPWWRGQGAPLTATVEAFKALIRAERVQLVYANTVVLDEPLLAAQECGVATVVHARELPAHDAGLCQTLGADAATVRAHVLARADRVIANSHCVARWLDGGGHAASVVPDAIDIRDFALPAISAARLRVAMISSNLPKKGLADFFALAQRLEQRVPGVECRLIGPDNAALALLRTRANQPANLVFTGPAPGPAAALATADIVVNLSHVEESFGRTVAEAMAGARPVVCYRWGALPELVLDGITGYTVPLGDVEAVTARVADLAADPALRERLGIAARVRIEQNFGPAALEMALAKALAPLGCLSDGQAK